MGDYLADNAYGFLPVPIIITEPAVGYGGGVAGLFLHETDEEKERRQKLAKESLDGGAQLVPPAMTAVAAAGTENGTWVVAAGHRRTWMNDSIRYMGGGAIGHANIDIYTNPYDLDFIGEIPALKFDTETDFAVIMQQVQFRLPKTNWLLGAKQVWSTSTLESSNTLVDMTLQFMDLDKTNNSGLGLVVEYDSRDNMFFPTKGYSLNADYMWHREEIGADHDYDTLSVEGQAFVPIGEKWIVAFAASFDSISTDETMLTPTANPYIDLRGVSAYRYQGDQVATAQAQLMYRIDNRWTILGFYGLGYTHNESLSPDFGNCFKSNCVKNSTSSTTVDAYGAGFRYQIARRYGLHMGIDLGFSDEEQALYFTVGTGF
ncbi:glyceraldehyde-3-phosphate dehydrogenase [Vibrio comitans NBRC 102076]|uniref:Glyceraldehyde-3-phosphate dehydrogenase n=2 Tax=Vibrio comitans TaxID=413401 RepID=A0A4Y3IQR0_9VIBR|nr:BamA/TamA family outer membrane protein [Vibrio comitans]GEA61158.1 glyceraldehyde-3-phosphate dehydrogenase [Vibrio comitans NBRC 102076]